MRSNIQGSISKDYSLLEILPYILVLIGGIVGINVLVVLLVGIVSGAVIVIATGKLTAFELVGNMGSGAAGMFETCMVAVCCSNVCSYS